MTFDKEIRARVATPYPAAPHLMAGGEGATERGILSFHHHGDITAINFTEGVQAWPESITLHASLSAIPIDHSQAQVALTIAGRDFLPQPFYTLETLFQEDQEIGKASQYQAIQVIYQGGGHYTNGAKSTVFEGGQMEAFRLDLPPHQEIFRREFVFQSEGVHHQKESPQGDFWLTVAPNGMSGERLYPLLAYGGYFKAGTDLKRMEPVFALIKQGDHEKTALQLLRASDLQQRGISPPRTQRKGHEEWIFCDDVKSEGMRSLAGALISGAATLKVFDAGGDNSCLYRSISYEQQDPHANHLTITFKAK